MGRPGACDCGACLGCDHRGGRDDLQARLVGWILGAAGPQGAHVRALTMLQAFHAGRGTPNADGVTARQALILFMISKGASVQDAAAAIPVSLATAKRDRQVLERVFGVRRVPSREERVEAERRWLRSGGVDGAAA